MMIYGNPSYDTIRTVKNSDLLKEWGRLGVFTSLKNIPYPDESVTKGELEEMVNLQKAVTPERFAYIKRVDEEFFKVMSELLSIYDIYEPVEDIEKTVKVYEPVIDYLKIVYNRPRPNQVAGVYNIPLYPLLESKVAGTASYPSGHTLFALIFHHIYSRRYPNVGKELMKFALDVKLTREQGGVHYPSDGVFSLKIYKQIAPWMDARESVYTKGVDKLNGY
jgi:hypothetical protein